MPLIMITGLPTSGKTTRARQLHAYLAERIASSPSPSPVPYRLHYISDDTLSIPRAAYDLSTTHTHERSANASEKDARAALYAAVKRVLSDRDVVVLDSLNYIKGMRYQLFCEAKAVRTPSVVVQVGCAAEQARRVNEERLERRRRSEGDNKDKKDETKAMADGGEQHLQEQQQQQQQQHVLADDSDTTEPYSPENWENLVFRYEEPNPMTRWDSPLFALIWPDDAAQAERTFSQVWDAIAGDKKPVVRPNTVTEKRTRDAGGDYLYVLERETQDIVRLALEALQEGGDEGAVQIPRKGKGDHEQDKEGEGALVLEMAAGVGLAQLQRLRRAFVALNRGGIGLEGVGNLAVDRIRELFVGYLNDYFTHQE